MAIVTTVPILILGFRPQFDLVLDRILAIDGLRLMPAPAVMGAGKYAPDNSAQLGGLRQQVNALRASLSVHAPADGNAQSAAADWSGRDAEDIVAWVSRTASDAARPAALDRDARTEEAVLAGYIEALQAMPGVLESLRTVPDTQLVVMVVPPARRPAIAELERGLAEVIGRVPDTFEAPISGGRTAILLALPENVPQLKSLLVASGLIHMDLSQLSPMGMSELVEALTHRMRAAKDRREAARESLENMARGSLASLESLDGELQRRIRRAALKALARHTQFVFVLAAWVPKERLAAVGAQLADAARGTIVTPMADDQATEPSPIIVRNPSWIASYEVFLRVFPITSRTRVDPTPFIALAFPIFFGLMLGDIGYGAVIAVLGIFLQRWGRERANAIAISAGTILMHSGLSAAAFGVLFGEIFGLSDRSPLAPVWFDRRQTPFAYLALVMGIGVGHLLTGYLIGFMQALRGRDRRRALRLTGELAGTAAAGILFALKLGLLPSVVLTPGLVILAVSLVLLVYAAGYRGPLELPSALVGFISYMRLFAVGLASASLAEAANHIGGLFESGVLGLLVAILLHAVFLGIGLISPAVQAARLHLVEFSGRVDGQTYSADSGGRKRL